MIAAMTPERVIGTGNGIPWHLPRDSQHFRAYTAGKPMLLGRRTFEEMDGWFTTQIPIILTHQQDYIADGSIVVHDMNGALAAAKETGVSEFVISGGAQIYATALQHATELILTVVEATVEGRARFPEFQSHGDWHCAHRESHPADQENDHAMEFQRWIRQSSG
ncbi:MAG: dihydrofolate reductase [Verrucomicrobiales bacterium]|jgi:dihydrofolate reductase